MKGEAKIGRGELEVLHYIQDHHPVSVSDVAAHMAAVKGHTRTTVLNVMERLRQKGFLTRRKRGGVYCYSPRQTKGVLFRRLIRDFVDKSLAGSVSPFVAYLAEEADLSAEDLRELRELIEDMERREGGEG